mgnify:CR=1 FL=1
MSNRDYYEILGVSQNASNDEIRAAFRKLARQYHPDVAKDKKTAEQKFKEINEAYEVLGDPAKRKKYDELGPNWKRIVSVKDRMRENTEIYVNTNGDSKTVRGLVVICAEPRELTLVNLVGPIDIDKLASLEGEFGIPHFSKEKHHEDRNSDWTLALALQQLRACGQGDG